MKFRAIAFFFLALASAQAVILYRTGDAGENTTEPTGPGYANSGWQYEGSWGGFLGTPFAPHFFLSAAHIGNAGSSIFLFQNQTYHVIDYAYDPQSDLVIWKVAEEFPSFAPLYSHTDEVGLRLIAIGRGTQRGAPILLNNALKGWAWGGGDGVQRWGENVVSSILPYGTNNDLVRSAFDEIGLPNECHLSVGDSGGAVFIQDGETWKLAGINFAVDTFYADSAGHGYLEAALFDRAGYFDSDNGSYVPLAGPSAFYATRISTKLPWIGRVIAQPEVGREADNLTMTYTKLVLPVTDVTYVVEQSSDLIDWQPATTSDEIVSTTGSTQVVKSKVVITPEAKAIFLRLRIARP